MIERAQRRVIIVYHALGLRPRGACQITAGPHHSSVASATSVVQIVRINRASRG
jgi:hypothetical protein